MVPSARRLGKSPHRDRPGYRRGPPYSEPAARRAPVWVLLMWPRCARLEVGSHEFGDVGVLGRQDHLCDQHILVERSRARRKWG